MLQDAPLYAYLPAKDLARARRFYEEKLGFRPRQEPVPVRAGQPGVSSPLSPRWIRQPGVPEQAPGP